MLPRPFLMMSQQQTSIVTWYQFKIHKNMIISTIDLPAAQTPVLYLMLHAYFKQHYMEAWVGT